MLNVIVIAMRLTKQMLYFVVAVTVTSLHFCNGKALNSEAVVENPSAPGSVQLRSVKHDSVAPARRGSLTFKFNEQSAPKSPRGKLQIISHLSCNMSSMFGVRGLSCSN